MILKLTNFRIFKKRTFEINEIGLVLLSGKSGHGKTTLFLAIQFALFDIGTSSIITHGEKTCEVELIYDNMRIIRTKNPRNLRLFDLSTNIEYANVIAQEIISKKYAVGSFDTIAYIGQDAENSFIKMSPLEKLLFIEKFAFKNDGLSEIKEKSKNYIEKTKTELAEIRNEIKIHEKFIQEFPEPVVNVILSSFSVQKHKTLEKYEESQISRKEKYEANMKKAHNKLSKLRNEYQELRIMTSILKEKRENLHKQTSQLETIILETSQTQYIGDEECRNLRKQLEILFTSGEYTKIENKIKGSKEMLDKMQNEIKYNLEDELMNLKSHLWEDYTKTECKELIDDIKEQGKDAKKISLLKNQLQVLNDQKMAGDQLLLQKLQDELNVLKDVEIRQRSYICPSCGVSVCMNDEHHTLEIVKQKSYHDDVLFQKNKEVIMNEIQNVEKKIKNLENSFIKYQHILDTNQKIEKNINEITGMYEEELDENLLYEQSQELEIYYTNEIKKENRIVDITKRIETNNFSSSSCMIMIKQIQEDEKILASLESREKHDHITYSENELQELIKSEEKKRDSLKRNKVLENKCRDEMNQLDAQIRKCQEDYIMIHKTIREETELIESIKEIEHYSKECKQKLRECHDIMEQIQKYKIFIHESKKHHEFKSKLEEYRQKEMEFSKKWTAAKILDQQILEAQSIAMTKVIDNINIHVNIYLEKFFVENPIYVNLSCFKEVNKETKSKINLEIIYRG